jgi:hypothetical protein
MTAKPKPRKGDDPIFAAIERAKHAIARADEARDKDAANYDKLFKKEWKALDAALETEPRTAAGAFALLLFTAKYGADCDCINKEQYIAVLANCALALADDEPVEISEQLAAVASGEKPPAGGRAVRPKRRRSVTALPKPPGQAHASPGAVQRRETASAQPPAPNT